VLRLYQENTAKIIDAIKKDFPNRGFYLSGEDGEVGEVEVKDVELDSDVDVLSITEMGEATITTAADVTFTAHVKVNDVVNGAFDKEDGRWIVLPTKEGTVTRKEWVQVEVMMYLSEDAESVEDLQCTVEADGGIQLDYSEWENWPSDLDLDYGPGWNDAN
jgi:hypothetical protein